MTEPGAAIISQSGALAAVMAVNMRHHGIRLTYSVSTGNEATHGVEDFIEDLIDEPGHARSRPDRGAIPKAQAISRTGETRS